jgi:hypothetical protein
LVHNPAHVVEQDFPGKIVVLFGKHFTLTPRWAAFRVRVRDVAEGQRTFASLAHFECDRPYVNLLMAASKDQMRYQSCRPVYLMFLSFSCYGCASINFLVFPANRPVPFVSPAGVRISFG